MKENVMATNFEPHEYVIFVQSTKIGTHENKAIHSMAIKSNGPDIKACVQLWTTIAWNIHTDKS